MKTRILKSTAVAIIAVLAMSFSAIKTEKKEIKASESSIHWVGEKVTGKHEGTIKIKEGFLEFKKDKLVGGTVIVDMETINVTDLTGNYKNKLEGHLKSDDFFGVANHKTAKLVFTKVSKDDDNEYDVEGEITIKGITEKISFEIEIEGNTAKTDVEIDRTKFGIKYGSSSFFDNLKDKAIDNEFDLDVKLVF